MAWVEVFRQIQAPCSVVFDTVSDIRNFAEALPHIVGYEFLTESQIGKGTRFRETRSMKGKPATTELEIIEFERDKRVRMVADSHGTVWDTIFTVAEEDGKTELRVAMDARAYKWLPRLLNPLIKGMVAKAVAKDMDLVQVHCEQVKG